MEELPEVGSYIVEITTHDLYKPDKFEDAVEFTDGTKEVWKKEGMIHRVGGPAIIRRNKAGKVIAEEWYLQNKRHRNNEPAFIYDDGNTRLEAWYEDGTPHRLDGPSLIDKRLESGLIFREEWCEYGRFHRVGAPAQIIREADSGIILFEYWYLEGELHRNDDKPALIERDEEDGLAYTQEWYQHGKLHRENGAAIIRRDGEFGEEVELEYYRNGQKIVPNCPDSLNLDN